MPKSKKAAKSSRQVHLVGRGSDSGPGGLCQMRALSRAFKESTTKKDFFPGIFILNEKMKKMEKEMPEETRHYLGCEFSHWDWTVIAESLKEQNPLRSDGRILL